MQIMRLIDADALKKEIGFYVGKDKEIMAQMAIDKQPTIECGKCQHKKWCAIDQDYICTNIESPLFGEEVGKEDSCEKGSAIK